MPDTTARPAWPHWPPLLERAIESLLPLTQSLPPLDPVGELLCSAKQDLVRHLALRYVPRLQPLQAGVLAHDTEAIARYDALVAEAVAALRSAHLPGWQQTLASLDRQLYRNGDELCDSPTLPAAERQHILATLHRFNSHSGSYSRWNALLAPLIAQAQQRRPATPVRIIDVAAGTGAFSIALKQLRGDSVDVVATDLMPEYLALGEAEATRLGMRVRFAVQDATDLRAAALLEPDLITCTQSLHHFPPGMAARMLGEASRCATSAVCFIDGERSLAALHLVVPLMALYGRRWPVVHDTAVSVRRMYVAEEMDLLARLAPVAEGSLTIESGRLPPGHAYVMLRRPHQAG